jgi:hypothetical protein
MKATTKGDKKEAFKAADLLWPLLALLPLGLLLLTLMNKTKGVFHND